MKLKLIDFTPTLPTFPANKFINHVKTQFTN